MADKKYEIFDQFEKATIELDKQRKKLCVELSKIDKERTDIEHYIDFILLALAVDIKWLNNFMIA